MKANLDMGLGVLDRFLSVINTRERAYVLILLWVLSALSYGVFKLFTVETIEHILLINKCSNPREHKAEIKKASHRLHELEAPIVPSL